MSSGDRWPGWVYDEGSEPDVRFSFANERTFLAWIRTALALVAAGVALEALDLDLERSVERPLALVLVLLGICVPPLAWLRWARSERAMRRQEPLPATRLGAVVAVGLVLVAVVLLVASA